jgi:hypothetical protein
VHAALFIVPYERHAVVTGAEGVIDDRAQCHSLDVSLMLQQMAICPVEPMRDCPLGAIGKG